ncbi:glutathionylspermidine synthase family protein [Aureimonas psammosilenae]|uniref:glutathionylspermidine synthase family protein n=1 Tax=Aureimonas psammosilenae TaxID=2495496 RepID=UPI0012609081|nr:glutathionylspermidine synthase family protein [Aureimonas psammosilenae]
MERLAIAPRDGWREKAESLGFGFHEMYGEPYWLDDVHYRFTMEEIETHVEAPTQALHELCMDLVAEVVASEELLARLAIPPEQFDTVRDSWNARARHLYGRFDLAYDGRGPAKLLEYNADTPTGMFEAAFFQHNWLTDQIALGHLPEAADQFNLLQESLVEAFAAFPADRIFHFAAVTDNEEDRGTTTYLMDCAIQAGHRTALIDMAAIGVDALGRFTDLEDRVIDRCFKLYPWEDMMREPFAHYLPRSGTEWVEPAWKAVLSNKGILPLLWERHPGHPNLLPAFFGDDPQAGTLTSSVRKPFHSREGENIAITETGRETEETDGDYGEGPTVVQALTPLFEADGQFAVLGTWVIGDRACGLGMREDRSRITRNLSRFVPHAIVD